jgi:hypothetical protein
MKDKILDFVLIDLYYQYIVESLNNNKKKLEIFNLNIKKL